MYVLLDFWQKIMAIPIMSPLSWFISVRHWNNMIRLLDTVVLVRVPWVWGNKLISHNIVSRVGINVQEKGFILDILVE